MSVTPAKMNPFPGLRPFTQEEDYLFFGREEQTIELLQRLGSNRFVAVVGTSGSGKSSLVRCGLLSELLGGRMLDAGAAWEIAVTHPGGNPLALLADSLLDADLYDREVENVRENLLATLSRSHFGLVEAVKQADIGEGTNFLVVVDQFEEIFRFNEAGQRQQEIANEFVSLLLEAAAQKEVPIYVVLTMRSDFIGECGQFEGLAEMVNRGEFLIPRLNRDQFKRVIEGPIKVAGGQIAPRLLQRLLNDLGQQADQLPCLQHALMRTWDVWAAKGDADALDLDDYQRVGRMSQALSLHADEIYESLASDRDRELCQGIFQALTVEESNSRGIRRPQRLGRLCQILEVTPSELRPIIDAYRRSGVTFLMPSPEVQLTEQTIIDISHESLMRVWTRLRQWVEEETQAAGIYHRLSESADLHEQNKAGLYRDPELGIALAWREAKRPNIAWAERYRPGFETAMRFLETSRQASVAEEQSREATRQRELEQAQQLSEAQQLRLEQQHRAAGRLRKLIGGLAVVAVIAGIACVAAMFANQRANRLAQDAQQNEEQAKKNEKRAEESQQETAKVLAVVASQKAAVDESLSKAKAAEEAGRQLLYTTDMRLAPFVWRDDRTTAEQLRVLLAKHVPQVKAAAGNVANREESKADLRGFEWHYYQHLLNNSSQVFARDAGPVIETGFTPTGQLVTVNEENQIRRWDLGTDAEETTGRRDLQGARIAQPHCLSPDGRLIASIRDKSVVVYETATGQELFRVAHIGTLHGHIFSRDHSRLVIVDDKIRWFSAADGELIASLDQKYNRLNDVALSPDGLSLVALGYGATAQQLSTFRLDLTSRTVVPQATDAGEYGTLSTGAISPDGQLVAVGYRLSGTLSIFDAVTGRMIGQKGAAHASPIASLAFSNDGSSLITGDTEGTIKIWAEPRKLSSKIAAVQTLKGHGGEIKSLRFSANGQRLASASADQTARVWNLANARASIRRLAGAGATYSVSISPDGQLMAAASGRTIRLWEAATGQCVRELPAPEKGQITNVAFSPVDKRLLAAGYGGADDISHVVLWDIDAGTELARLPGATDLPGFPQYEKWIAVGALAFSPDGKSLVAGFGSPNLYTPDATPTPLKVWDVATRRVIRRLNGHVGYCISARFSRDGTLMVSGSRDGTAIIWSTETWQPKQTLLNPDKDSLNRVGAPGMVESVDFSPDGKIMAMASREANLHLWDVASGQLLETLKGHSSSVDSVAFSPDGRTLASGSGDRTVRLWNMLTRRELLQLDPGSIDLGQVKSLAFSPDGKQLLAGGYGTAAFWSASPNAWNDLERSAETLRQLLKSNADFPSRIRMFSENLRLHEALEKLDSKDVRVQAALAAMQANWQASRQDWPAAVAALDRLLATKLHSADAWLRTPGLLRLATALVHQDRPHDAAALLTGGTKRRQQDGLTAIEQTGLGFKYEEVDGVYRVTELLPEYPGSRGGLLLDDMLVKVNDIELTSRSIAKLLAGEAGTKVRLTVQHAQDAKLETIELTRERFVHDAATGESLRALRAAVDERLALAPTHVGLLNLRAELAGQWSDQNAQIVDLTAAIEVLKEQPQQLAAAELRRLYAARGNAYFALKQWQKAAADYARCVTPETTDDVLLSNQAMAMAEVILAAPQKWTVLKPTELTSSGGAMLTLLPDDSILASGKNPLGDSYKVVADATVNRISVIRLEALTHETLPNQGPGRDDNRDPGNFGMIDFKITAFVPGSPPSPIELNKVVADYFYKDLTFKNWNISGGKSNPHTAVYLIKQPLDFKDGARIEFKMKFSASPEWPGQNLGCFRLSVSEDPAAFDQELERLAASKHTDPWQKFVAAQRLQGNHQAIEELITRLPRLAGKIGDLYIQGKDLRDEDWQHAVDIYSRGITPETSDFDLLSKRALAYERLKNWTAATADFTRVAKGTPDGARMLADYARKLASGQQFKSAVEAFDKSRALYEAMLKADEGNNIVAADLAQLLLDQARSIEADWTFLKPADATTDSGLPLTVQEDGSIQVPANKSETPQTVRWQPGTSPARLVRVEMATPSRTSKNSTLDFSEYQISAMNPTADASTVLRGRYVRLDLPGDSDLYPRYPADQKLKYLGLAELQVFQGDRNIALRKKASSSSIFDPARTGAQNAVDGNTVGNDDGNPYAHTAWEANPWWEVDLGSDQAIDRIQIWNRSDVPLFVRMNHFRIRVLDRDRKVLFERVIDQAPSPSTEILPRTFFAVAGVAPTGENQPLAIRLPLPKSQDAPSYFRVSTAATSVIQGVEDTHQMAMKCDDVLARLAVGYALLGRTDDAVKYFSKALALATHDTRQPIIDLAARFDKVLTLLIQKYPEDQFLQLAVARSLAKQGVSNVAARQPQRAQAVLEQAQALLAQIRTRAPDIKWTVLPPRELKSTGGETLTVEDDGAVLVTGPNPVRAVYTLKLPVSLAAITGIRLEAIPDTRLPEGGAGRFGNGNFHLAEVKAAVESNKAGSTPESIKVSTAVADGPQTGASMASASIDGDPRTYWDPLAAPKGPHWAVYVLPTPVKTDGSSLSITLDSGISEWNEHGLGHFRLLVTNEPDVLQRTQNRIEFKESEQAEVSIALASAHAQQGRTDDAVALLTTVLKSSPGQSLIPAIIAAAAAEGLLDKLTASAANNTDFHLELVRHFADAGQESQAELARRQARTLLEQQLLKEPANAALAATLANLLLPATDSTLKLMVPTSEREPIQWRYTTTQPETDWSTEKFDDARWSLASGVPGKDWPAHVAFRTEWKTPDIWLRRSFEWQPKSKIASVLVRAVHDDGFEVSINGKQVYQRTDVSGRYNMYLLDASVLELLKPGTNTLAVHCVSTFGAQYIDVGLHGTSDPWLDMTMIKGPWARLAVAYHLLGDQLAVESLIKRNPEAAGGLGDFNRLNRAWDKALIEYNRAITSETQDAALFAGRAEAHQKLEHWDLAIADWTNADLYSIDKTTRYGDPPVPAMEQRAYLHGRLKKWDLQALDFTEMLRPERFGNNPWFFMKRGEAYDESRIWDKALADYDQAIKLSSASDAGQYHFYRARHLAARGKWRQAGEDMRLCYAKPSDFKDGAWPRSDWWGYCNAALIYAMAGDVPNCQAAAAGFYQKYVTVQPDHGQTRWIISCNLLQPDTINGDNRTRLLELAGKMDDYWKPRMTAAIHFRSGEYQKAAELFEAHEPGNQFWHLAAMNYYSLGNSDKALQLLARGDAWIQEQRAKDEGAIVPAQAGYWWDWVGEVAFQAEATDLILGPIAGEPKKLAVQGQLAEAANVYAKALADAPDQNSRSRILNETALFDGVTAAVHVLNSDWKNAASSFTRDIETKAGVASDVWMLAPALWAYTGDSKGHQDACRKMYERYQKSATPEDAERILKMMMLAESGMELPPDLIKKFVDSAEMPANKGLAAWFSAARALLECRRKDYPEAHKWVDKTLALEKEQANANIKALALSIRAITYAKQKDRVQARTTLQEVKVELTSGVHLKWNADGTVDGATVLDGTRIDHDRLIPEVLRREAELLLKTIAE